MLTDIEIAREAKMLPITEVADRLGMKLSTVKTKLYRTLERQKKKFGI